ncbi:excalibur calcium-binding domain-containing protein [Ensifer sp. ENS09]|uniref:excalibur calcium-binding domain-containing protein n=1 Tax=Ensifer sp. ENS09 TaxID=2769263 RepID=UPI0017816BB5|nr:excalibur calcium-binding domain-containing protein [Ensifer sp. ENS09]MBD9652922.1 excalibur calcium-binding domain-containing protein [Ensifer sp. ENS09]
MKRTLNLVAGFGSLMLTACASTSPSPATLQAPDRSALSSATLWQALSIATTTSEKMAIEAELATRGETSFGSEYLGRQSAALVGVSSYARTNSSSGDHDCADFGSSAQAQKFFLANGGPYSDPHGLDRDGDGMACEFGTLLVSNVARYRTTSASALMSSSVPASNGHCFVGPRGGTYTITASGRKNYGGC